MAEHRLVPTLRGLSVLVVEDDFLVASALCDLLKDCGCEVVGPVPRLCPALALAGEVLLNGAILDVNLAGEYSFPVAHLLRERRVPFLFLTAYCDGSIFPPDLQDVPRLFKPYDDKAVADAAARAFARHTPG
jgi:DNA-binding NarL/FixJ family response regulator